MKKSLGWILGAALFAAAGVMPALAFAQDAAEDRAETFEAAEPGAQTENVPGGMLLVGAYGVIWALMMGYVVSIGFRQARTAKELDRLREDLAQRPADED